MDDYHIPVLLSETIELLQVKNGKKYVDCTVGGGGHTRLILERGGTVLAIDQDREAIEWNEKDKRGWILEKKLFLRQGNFAHLKEIIEKEEWGGIDGILMDLGVSSHQLETDYRGFSFNKAGKLDMRMDPNGQTVTAGDLVNAGSEKELANLFWKFGEERDSRRIAKEIVENRKQKVIETTDELAKIVLKASRANRSDRTHPATRIFQALRIAVNDELANLETALLQATEVLGTGGRLAVISFHSLEDRIVKNFFRDKADTLQTKTNKPVTPTKEEIDANPRARSGKLRVVEKI